MQTSEKLTVYKNGRIYTANRNHEYVSAIAVRDGRFIYAGDDAGAAPYEAQAFAVVDLAGALVTPGLIEGHDHYGFMAVLDSLGFQNIPAEVVTVEGSLALVKQFVQQHPDYDQYIMGNFSQNLEIGTRQLDEICSEKPIVCVGMGLHCMYFNSKFMEEGGITKDTPDVIPGKTFFFRDENGVPTGKTEELPQTWVAFQMAVKPDNDKVKKEFLKLQELYYSFGCTGITDGGFLGLDEANMLKNITELEAEGKLKMVVSTSSIWYGRTVTPLEEIKKRAIDNKKKYTTALVHPGTVKMWADGTIGELSALMREPYEGTDRKGTALSLEEDLVSCAQMCKENDLNVHFHAIGDQAIENVLTAYETVGKSSGVQSIAHFQINPPDIIERAARIDGLVVNMTPFWNSTGVPEEVDPVGERRNTYGLVRETMDAGIPVNFGSDSNGAPNAWNPVLNIMYAMMRDPQKETTILKGRSCSFEQTIDAYSINPAKERRIDDAYGSIEAGKFADFTVWDVADTEKVMKEGPEALAQAIREERLIHAVKVYFHGDQVFDRKNGSPLGYGN